MLIRREAVTRCGPGFVEAVIPPPCPPATMMLTAALRSERITTALSQFPWPATSPDMEYTSLDKHGSGRGTSAALLASVPERDARSAEPDRGTVLEARTEGLRRLCGESPVPDDPISLVS